MENSMDTHVGHNKPPSQIEFAQGTAETLGHWLKEYPVVASEDDAHSGKLLVDRARLSLQDLDDERKARVRPLQGQVKAIDDEYRSPKSILEKLLTELKERLNAWVKREEENRLRALEKARKAAEAAEKAAQEAEARELAAIDESRTGVESDVGPLTKEANVAFHRFQQTERELARAEKATDVKIGGGFNRALSTRFKEELVVENPLKALSVMGWSERLVTALLMDAREYRRSRGRLPDGIVDKGKRSL